jgi:hypothetical protein
LFLLADISILFFLFETPFEAPSFQTSDHHVSRDGLSIEDTTMNIIPPIHGPLIGRIAILFLVTLFLSAPSSGQELDATDSNGAPETILAGEMEEIARIRPRTHRSLGWLSAELGDLNGDGYDDFVVSTYTDTTFIYLGGDTIAVEPFGYVLGGSSGLRTADFNGDGLIDIATSIKTGQTNDPDPHWQGRIRIYLNTGSGSYYRTAPDMVLEGDSAKTESGFWGTSSEGIFQGIDAIDFNGDGHVDLLVQVFDWKMKDVRYALFMGPFPYGTQPDLYLEVPVRGARRTVIRDYFTGDINCDGKTDVLVGNGWTVDSTHGVTAWDVFLGSADLSNILPSFTLRNDSGWFFDKYFPAIADINNDGCDDIFASRAEDDYGRLKIFYGRKHISEISPSDSLFNPDPKVFNWMYSVSPVGDLNGDGTRDILVGWGLSLFPNANVFNCYPNRSSDLHLRSAGAFGIDPDYEYVDVTRAYPAGDVNNDGYDDVLILGRSTVKNSLDPGNGFKIYGGSQKLVGIRRDAVAPSSDMLHVYPNPVSFGSDQLHVDINSLSGRHSSLIEIFDALGKKVFTTYKEIVAGRQTVHLGGVYLAIGHYILTVKGIPALSTSFSVK